MGIWEFNIFRCRPKRNGIFFCLSPILICWDFFPHKNEGFKVVI